MAKTIKVLERITVDNNVFEAGEVIKLDRSDEVIARLALGKYIEVVDDGAVAGPTVEVGPPVTPKSKRKH